MEFGHRLLLNLEQVKLDQDLGCVARMLDRLLLKALEPAACLSQRRRRIVKDPPVAGNHVQW